MGLSTMIAWGAFVVAFIVMVLIRAGEIGSEDRKGRWAENKETDGRNGPL